LERWHPKTRDALTRDNDDLVTPNTILAWHRKLVAQKFDGSQQRQVPGRPQIAHNVTMADWGFLEPELLGISPWELDDLLQARGLKVTNLPT